MLYRAFLEIESDYTSSGFFPDIPGCIFACDNPREAIESAASAVDAHFKLMAEKGMKFPQPSKHFSENTIPVNFNSKKLQATAWFDFDVNIERYTTKS
ncbi:MULTISPECIES: type II toxin-antitoxin system HicB family antitoxin [Pantoea]|uniref:type II toxin-antitoxin system HicB family antitoxin n=1 Tax=Pantoea TaxID=53335 RepID=UPI000B5A81B9|nr:MULTISPECIES: type II toxin-antitoxin system HicB family antitoxin [Pantoea]MDS7721620.1 type II toxin-antitoxin system HicB family antitoxin [Pantoea ananatis]OWY74303.1 hypothetical protein CDN97_24305 [Pantoea sp. AMG 501]